jgi:hypothetical protein
MSPEIGPLLNKQHFPTHEFDLIFYFISRVHKSAYVRNLNLVLEKIIGGIKVNEVKSKFPAYLIADVKSSLIYPLISRPISKGHIFFSTALIQAVCALVQCAFS